MHELRWTPINASIRLTLLKRTGHIKFGLFFFLCNCLRAVFTRLKYNGSSRSFLAICVEAGCKVRTIQELNFKRRDARARARTHLLTHSLTHKCNNSVGGLTVGSIFLQIDFNLIHSQPGVLVDTEVVQNFGRRFSVRIFHVAEVGVLLVSSYYN